MRNTTLILMLLILAATGTAQAAGSGLPVKNTVTDGVREWMERESVFGGQVYLRTAGNPDHPPVVLIHGLGDEASTSWDASIEALIPNARLELIPGGGHMAFIERLELFNNMLTLHLQQHRQDRGRDRYCGA
ncbi:MAG: alpha/beta hydrolase [Candidatus Thiodiazotropha sp. (ex Dulcina madagascariensis)]|nr:alpha/beta hydrolase [Candidatus Thiodiazotropha sp. (ex Dulcina madagascariensis)]